MNLIAAHGSAVLVRVQSGAAALFRGTAACCSGLAGYLSFQEKSAVAAAYQLAAALVGRVVRTSTAALLSVVAFVFRVFSYKTLATLHYYMFETHLLQNIACALVLTALGHLYLSLPDDTSGGAMETIGDAGDIQEAAEAADAASRVAVAAAAAARGKTRIALSSGGGSSSVLKFLRDALSSVGSGGGGAVRRRLAASLGGRPGSHGHAEPAAPLAVETKAAPATPTKGGGSRGAGAASPSNGSVWSSSSPGGLSYRDDVDDDDETDDDTYDDEEEEKELPSIAAARQKHAFIVKEAAANPAALVGWQITVQGKGLGLVLGIKRRLGQATLFRVQFDTGNVQLLSLKRSDTKGDTPFAPVAKVAD